MDELELEPPYGGLTGGKDELEEKVDDLVVEPP